MERNARVATLGREGNVAHLAAAPLVPHARTKKEETDMAQVKKILLVDDDDDLREALGEQLVMTEDFDVFEASSGASAMSKSFR